MYVNVFDPATSNVTRPICVSSFETVNDVDGAVLELNVKNSSTTFSLAPPNLSEILSRTLLVNVPNLYVISNAFVSSLY